MHRIQMFRSLPYDMNAYYFFLSMFTKWRISNWSLIGPFSSTGDQVNMWPEERRCIIAAVIFYSDRQCLLNFFLKMCVFHKRCECCFLQDEWLNDNPLADVEGVCSDPKTSPPCAFALSLFTYCTEGTAATALCSPAQAQTACSGMQKCENRL